MASQKLDMVCVAGVHYPAVVSSNSLLSATRIWWENSLTDSNCMAYMQADFF
jgi:hypothetical protein